jgi:Spy/CpxP family protein refolding chaperone
LGAHCQWEQSREIKKGDLKMKWQIILTVISATALCAQGPRGLGWGPGGPPTGAQPNLGEVKTYLSLTDAQIQSLQAIGTQERTAIDGLHQQIATKRQALDKLTSSGSTDATAMGNLLVEMQNLRKQITAVRNSLQPQALNVLTADQKTKLNNLQSATQNLPAMREAGYLGLLTSPAGPGAGLGFGPRMGLGACMGGGPGMGMGLGPRAARRGN